MCKLKILIDISYKQGKFLNISSRGKLIYVTALKKKEETRKTRTAVRVFYLKMLGRPPSISSDDGYNFVTRSRNSRSAKRISSSV